MHGFNSGHLAMHTSLLKQFYFLATQIQVPFSAAECHLVTSFKIRLQPFCKLFSHIIYGDIKTRYNVFRKTEYDVFGGKILQLKRLIL